MRSMRSTALMLVFAIVGLAVAGVLACSMVPGVELFEYELSVDLRQVELS